MIETAPPTRLESRDALAIAREEILPGLHALCAQLEQENDATAHAFFRDVARSVEAARDTEDLAAPFIALSTSAFRGFVFGPVATVLLDQVLEAAQNMAHTLSAAGDAH